MIKNLEFGGHEFKNLGVYNEIEFLECPNCGMIIGRGLSQSHYTPLSMNDRIDLEKTLKMSCSDYCIKSVMEE